MTQQSEELDTMGFKQAKHSEYICCVTLLLPDPTVSNRHKAISRDTGAGRAVRRGLGRQNTLLNCGREPSYTQAGITKQIRCVEEEKRSLVYS